MVGLVLMGILIIVAVVGLKIGDGNWCTNAKLIDAADMIGRIAVCLVILMLVSMMFLMFVEGDFWIDEDATSLNVGTWYKVEFHKDTKEFSRSYLDIDGFLSCGQKTRV